jgi:hypothetical protein
MIAEAFSRIVSTNNLEIPDTGGSSFDGSASVKPMATIGSGC